MRRTSDKVAGMVGINETVSRHEISMWLQCVPWNGLRSPSIKIMPVAFHKSALINVRVKGIKSKCTLRVSFEITKDMVNLLQMTFTRQDKVR